MRFKIFLIILIFGITFIWVGNVYSHKGEKHERPVIKEVEAEKTPDNIQEETIPPTVTHEAHEHLPEMKTGSFNLIQVGKKPGYNIALIFTITIVVIWGLVSFYWKDSDK